MPPNPSRDHDFEIRTTEYLHIVCSKCGEDAEIRYLGLDPVIPKVQVTCPKCGASKTWKLFKSYNFPPK